MKLLYFTREPHPTYRADVAILFGKYLPRHGIYSDLVTIASAAKQADKTWGGGNTFLCPRAHNRVLNVIRPFLHTLVVLWRAKRRPYDGYQVRDNPVQAAIVLIMARVRRVKFFYWMSFPVVEAYFALASEGIRHIGLVRYCFAIFKGYAGRWLLYHAVLPRADHVFVQSDRMLEDMIEHGIDRSRLTPVPMGVDIESADPDRIPASDDPRLSGRRVIVYLGTLEPARRIELLFEMLAILRKSVPNVLLVLVGDTHDANHRAWLNEQARKMDVNELVLFTGWLETESAWRYVRMAEVGLSPFPRGSLLDSASPTKAIEYMAFGLPVLVNDQPDQARVMVESGAGVCVPLSATNFATALIDMLTSPEKLDAWRRAGPSYIRATRSYSIISAKVADVYKRNLRVVLDRQ